MAINLQKGQRIEIGLQKVGVGLGWDPDTSTGYDFDLDTKGTPITINLQYGETIEVDEVHIIALLNIAENQIQSNRSFGNLLGGEGLSMMRVTGPGTVYLSPSKFMIQALQ